MAKDFRSLKRPTVRLTPGGGGAVKLADSFILFGTMDGANGYAEGFVNGADAELDACAEQLKTFQYSHLVQPLKDARRPKPPSARQKARNALALAMREAGKGGRIFDGSPFYELQGLIEELPDA